MFICVICLLGYQKIRPFYIKILLYIYYTVALPEIFRASTIEVTKK